MRWLDRDPRILVHSVITDRAGDQFVTRWPKGSAYVRHDSRPIRAG
ncbi:hypothetical protein [Paractinoplanes durhamensis]|uniref:Uncharacterized protein n=1 Tax=Paractinoplanes durhamensis TaxID=113563 RepID=A0ABQ3Z015_9ACTN|nr:hypothetical protein [Actinoplanes durhamensis]GIE03158.1 hypothetical protein Adu01nite_45080 [Actinoplanes durhamensis]